MFNIIIVAGAVGAGAVSRYGPGSGSDQMMRLRLRNTGFEEQCTIFFNWFVLSLSLI
jgi:hypothetical protein